MKKYICKICGWIYDEAQGDLDNGIAPGTKFEDLPADYRVNILGFVCDGGLLVEKIKAGEKFTFYLL